MPAGCYRSRRYILDRARASTRRHFSERGCRFSTRRLSARWHRWQRRTTVAADALDSCVAIDWYTIRERASHVATRHRSTATARRRASRRATAPQAQAPRSGAAPHSGAALQPPNGGGVCPLDSSVHRLPQQEASVRDGGRRRLGVSDLARRRAARQCLHARPGARRSVVSLQGRVARRDGECPAGGAGPDA
jgi:hypothetical protein